MKAEITNEGCLTITAEIPTEEFALWVWWKLYTGADDVPKMITTSLRVIYDKETREAFDPYKPGEGK